MFIDDTVYLTLSNTKMCASLISSTSYHSRISVSLIPLYVLLIALLLDFCRVDAATFGVYRSQCRTDVLFKKASTFGKYLAGSGNNLIETQTSTTLPACAKGCLKVPACLSINFFKSENGNKCDLMRISKTSTGARYIPNAGWVHYEPVIQVSQGIFNL